MTDQERKAMEMALDALELERTDTNGNKVDLVIPAIKALRTALAQPEQEPVAFEDWLKNQHGDPEEIGFLQALRVAYYAGADSHPAPPSKPWVSLTENQIELLWCEPEIGRKLLQFARAIEAALRSKNDCLV